MKLRSVTYEQWRQNHQEDHPAKWYRKFYPFNLFAQIDFSECYCGVAQTVVIGRSRYVATVETVKLQINGRYKASVMVTTSPVANCNAWDVRVWDCRFEVVYSQDGQFITVFASKLDPTKDLVTRFMRGNFSRIELQRSSPISTALTEALVGNIAEQLFPNGSSDCRFEWLSAGRRALPEHPSVPRKRSNRSAPLYALDRKIWVCFAFSEERAHRVAYCMANQCERLIVVYVNPTFTRHHRCVFPETEVLSLFEFLGRLPAESWREYRKQILFLQSHLIEREMPAPNQLLAEIHAPKMAVYPICKADLMESLGVMRTSPDSPAELFHFLAAMNLINAWIAQGRSSMRTEARLFKDMYFFKTYLARTLSLLQAGRRNWARLHVEGDLVLVELDAFQFSFHHVPLDENLRLFAASIENKRITWQGKRLQPIAPLVLAYARTRLLDV